ncbi:ATP-dependent DNA ligase [Streptomyces sp. NP160]|uniref:ATP-dependent DNA ligase n=1 Tax=Streptomyces sp. NP160 TaxID=2586637 RepID=UPI001C57FA56|nr:ATP-dependent DNA ligase [Streptomyces sp. NP160]
MRLPVIPPVAPMLAKAVKDVTTVPDQDSVAGGLLYEPKWDGFRCIVFKDGDAVELGSRGTKPLTRYFPELVEHLRAQLPERCVVDGEVVVRRGEPGAERLDWEALAQRIHPAASRITLLSQTTPASFVAFDLLALGDDDLTSRPFADRRAALEEALAAVSAPVHLTRTTTDAALAQEWLQTFEGAGLDGVVAKPLAAPYSPGKRVMLKIKHARTADVVVVGYRVHKSGSGVGSLLLGLHDDDGQLRQVGGASAFTDKVRLQLEEELQPLVLRDDDGAPRRQAGEKNRFAAADKDASWIPLSPELVAEVKYDQLEGDRFRHTVQLARWRPDRDPASCRFDQLDVPADYDLADVLTGG